MESCPLGKEKKWPAKYKAMYGCHNGVSCECAADKTVSLWPGVRKYLDKEVVIFLGREDWLEYQQREKQSYCQGRKIAIKRRMIGTVRNALWQHLVCLECCREGFLQEVWRGGQGQIARALNTRLRHVRCTFSANPVVIRDRVQNGPLTWLVKICHITGRGGTRMEKPQPLLQEVPV